MTTLTTTDPVTGDSDQATPVPCTRHSLLCAQAAICPLALYCPNTGTDECDDGEGCPAC